MINYQLSQELVQCCTSTQNKARHAQMIGKLNPREKNAQTWRKATGGEALPTAMLPGHQSRSDGFLSFTRTHDNSSPKPRHLI